MNREQFNNFCDELDRLVHRFRMEYDLTYGEVVAALEFKKFTMMMESKDNHPPK